jgi:hypothetical protein
VPIEDFLNAGALAGRLEKLDRVFCDVGRHLPDSVGPPSPCLTSTSPSPAFGLLSILPLFWRLSSLRHSPRW